MKIHKSDTALVIIDPQNDVLSEKGVSWGLIGASIKENHTVKNIESLFQAAKEGGVEPSFLRIIFTRVTWNGSLVDRSNR